MNCATRCRVSSAEVFADDSIVLHDTTTAADVDGWDSLMHINIVIAVEKHFGIRFATAEISRLKGDDPKRGDFSPGYRQQSSTVNDPSMEVSSLEFLCLLLAASSVFPFLPRRSGETGLPDGL